MPGISVSTTSRTLGNRCKFQQGVSLSIKDPSWKEQRVRDAEANSMNRGEGEMNSDFEGNGGKFTCSCIGNSKFQLNGLFLQQRN